MSSLGRAFLRLYGAVKGRKQSFLIRFAHRVRERSDWGCALREPEPRRVPPSRVLLQLRGESVRPCGVGVYIGKNRVENLPGVLQAQRL